jgi:hypothetical protein
MPLHMALYKCTLHVVYRILYVACCTLHGEFNTLHIASPRIVCMLHIACCTLHAAWHVVSHSAQHDSPRVLQRHDTISGHAPHDILPACAVAGGCGQCAPMESHWAGMAWRWAGMAWRWAGMDGRWATSCALMKSRYMSFDTTHPRACRVYSMMYESS